MVLVTSALSEDVVTLEIVQLASTITFSNDDDALI